MSTFFHTIVDPDSMVTCPYDHVHQVRQKKLSYHLMKCKKGPFISLLDDCEEVVDSSHRSLARIMADASTVHVAGNFPGVTIVTCPFNAQHMVRDDSLGHHMRICPDKDFVEGTRPSELEDPFGIDSAANDVPTYFPDSIEGDDEEWEAGGDGIIPSGVDARQLAGIGKYKTLAGLQPAEKKLFYENLRKDDSEANVKLFEKSTNIPPTVSADDETVKSSPPAPKPFVTPGRGRGLRAAVRVVTANSPGTHSKPVILNLEELQRSARKTKKKLKQITHLLERQANGATLNDEERIKVANKATYETQYNNLLLEIKARETPGQFDDEITA